MESAEEKRPEGTGPALKTEKSLNIAGALERIGFAVVPIKGVSMMPLLRAGRDTVKIVPYAPGEEPKRDDITLFRRKNGDTVLHRTVKKKKNVFYIRGDNCTYSEHIRREQILGRAEGIFLDGEYHACTEPVIRRFAARQRLTLPFRAFRAYGRKALRMLTGRGKGKKRKA